MEEGASGVVAGRHLKKQSLFGCCRLGYFHSDQFYFYAILAKCILRKIMNSANMYQLN